MRGAPVSYDAGMNPRGGGRYARNDPLFRRVAFLYEAESGLVDLTGQSERYLPLVYVLGTGPGVRVEATPGEPRGGDFAYRTQIRNRGLGTFRIPFTEGNDLTFEMWVKADDTVANNAYNSLFSLRPEPPEANNSLGVGFFSFYDRDNTNRYYIGDGAWGGSPAWRTTNTPIFNAVRNEFTHLAFTFNSVTRLTSVYLNGIFIASGTNNSANNTSSAYARTLYLSLGYDYETSGSASDPFWVKRARVTRALRTPAEFMGDFF